MRRAPLVLSCSWLALAACAPSAVRSPPPEPPAAISTTPADLLPRDLDAALRVDVTRLAGDLGAPLAKDVLIDLIADRAHERETAWLADAIDQSEVAWVGFRIQSDLHSAEKVLIARGDFARLRARAPAGFRSMEPAGGSPAGYVREVESPGAFERIYALDDGLLVASTSATMDPLEGSSPDAANTEGRLHPPERGTVSAAARAAELSQLYLRAFPKLAERFAAASQIAAYLEPHADCLDLDVEITFGAAEQAESSGQVLLALLQRIGEQQPCALGEAARAARVEAFDRSVRIRAELAAPVVQGLKACAFAGECCGSRRD